MNRLIAVSSAKVYVILQQLVFAPLINPQGKRKKRKETNESTIINTDLRRFPENSNCSLPTLTAADRSH